MEGNLCIYAQKKDNKSKLGYRTKYVSDYERVHPKEISGAVAHFGFPTFSSGDLYQIT